MLNRSEELLRKFLSKTASNEEQQELFSLLNMLSYEELDSILEKSWEDVEGTHALSPEAQSRVLNSILKRRTRWWPRYLAAASIILALITAYYLLLPGKSLQQSDRLSASVDIASAANQAILKLANGKVILLDGQANGMIGAQSGTAIYKDTAGALRYEPQSTSKNQATVYDTLTTPGGGVYNITLADGTRVWLNAATSLRFPESFNGSERKVELIYGEAYFEVIHSAAMPFNVMTPQGEVNDLGTHFNINAYTGAAERTTLLEGSVAVRNNGKPVVLKPGEQAEIDGSLLHVREVDVNDVVAWKNGLFVFNRTRLSDVMQELGRWYNVHVSYNDAAAKEQVLIASVSRYKSILEVLNLLEMAGKVRFELNGNAVTVKMK